MIDNTTSKAFEKNWKMTSLKCQNSCDLLQETNNYDCKNI